jgi:hypothetical protein
MGKLEDKLAKLEEQRARINAEIQRVRAREQQQERRDDTRRKIIVGAMLTGMIEAGKLGQFNEVWLRAELDKQLDRDQTEPCLVCHHWQRLSQSRWCRKRPCGATPPPLLRSRGKAAVAAKQLYGPPVASQTGTSGRSPPLPLRSSEEGCATGTAQR